MFRLLLSFFVIFALQGCSSSLKDAPSKEVIVHAERVEIKKGRDRMFKLNFKPSAKVQVSDTRIVNYLLIPNRKEITFTGINPGVTNVRLRGLDGEVKILYEIIVVE